MKNKICLLLLLMPFLISTAARAQDPKQPAQPTPKETEDERRFREAVMRPVVYRVDGMDKVKVMPDLDYAKSGSEFRKMDVYQPPNLAKTEKLPAVIFLHGGASERLRAKDWGIYVSWGRLVAASGMIGVTFTHRLGFPKTLLEEGMSDVNAAIAYVRENADALNVDKDRICLIAFSAGGPLLSQAMREKPAYVRCLVAYYAFMDVQQSTFHQQSETVDVIRKFSNVTYLAAPDAEKIAPLLIARAGRDAIPTMNDSIDRFIQAAVAKNLPLTVVNHPNGAHGFDNSNDDERSREIIGQTIAFMKFHLGLKKQ